MHGDGGGGGFGDGHSGEHGRPASHDAHAHHAPAEHRSTDHRRAGTPFLPYGSDPEARHRRARSPVGTAIKWVLLAVAMIVVIVLVGWAH